MCGDVFRRHWKLFLGATFLVGLFSAVYEYFGHGVMSDSMIFAFLYPLILGLIPIIALAHLGTVKKIPYAGAIRFGINLFYTGIATLTVGSLATGVIEIYGTTNRLLKFYTLVGIPFLFVGLLVSAIAIARAVNLGSKKKAVFEE